jgi:formylglycine-generating enzyme required for sulfatase activity
MKVIHLSGVILVIILALATGLIGAQTPTPGVAATPTATPIVPLPPSQDVSGWYDFILKIWAWLVAHLGFWGAVIALPVVLFLVLLLVGVVTKGPEDVYNLAKAAPGALWRRLHRPALDPALRTYLERGVCQKYCHLDVKALHEKEARTLVRLREVYIPLRGRGGRPEELSPRMKPTERAGREMAESILQREGPAPLLTAFLSRYPNLVLLGRAGSGKSTFLQYTAGLLAEAVLSGWPKETPDDLRRAFPRPPVPIYFPLRDFRPFWEELKLKEKTLERQGEALLRFLGENYKTYGLDEAFFRRLLAQGRCLLFLDGLDEVKAELRPTMVAIVEDFVRLYAAQDTAQPNRYVVACRPEAIREQAMFGHNFVEVTIEALDQQQVADFIPRWYREVLRRDGVLTPEAEQEADEKTRSLLQALEVKPQIKELTDTPLLLTMVALIHHRTGLPESRAELYWRCVELLLEKWDISRPGELAKAAMKELTSPEVPAGAKDRAYYLEPAAYWFLEAGLDRAKREEWARQIALWLGENPEEAERRLLIFLDWAAVVRSSLIEERETGTYAFTHHRTFQEYLAARYLAGREERWQGVAMGYVPNRDWWETLRLLAAVLDPGQRRIFLEKAIATAPPEGLLLTGTCLAEIQDEALKGALQGQVQTALRDLMLQTDQPLKDMRLLAGDLLGRLDDPRPDVHCPVPFMVPVPGGTCRLGSTPAQVERWNKEGSTTWYNNELPQHEVILPTFSISKYPVTNVQFRRFREAKGYERQEFWTPQGWAWRRGEYEPDLSYIADEDLRRRVKEWLDQRKQRDKPFFWDTQPWNLSNRPVVGVTWFEAAAYCQWLSQETGTQYRLPTEAEWEYAARGSSSWEWPWGDTFDPARANTSESDLGQTSPVGLFPGGETWCGAQDMAGNVWEWCRSLYKPYPYRADDSREDPQAAGARVLRGGSWSGDQGLARCAFRVGGSPADFLGDIGFRVVFSPN